MLDEATIKPDYDCAYMPERDESFHSAPCTSTPSQPTKIEHENKEEEKQQEDHHTTIEKQPSTPIIKRPSKPVRLVIPAPDAPKTRKRKHSECLPGMNTGVFNEKQMQIAETLCLTIIEKAKREMFRHAIRDIATASLTLWIRMKQTTYYQNIAKVFDFNSFVVILMYSCAKGLKIGKDEIILEQNKSLYSTLPSTRNLRQFGIKINRFTKNNLYFKEMIRELSIIQCQ